APAAPDDEPVPVVTEEFYSFVIASGLLYWEAHCFEPVELAAAQDGADAEGQAEPVLPAEVEGGISAFIKRQPVNGGLRTTMATAGDYRDCRTFEQMYADADGVYFVDREVDATPTIV